MALIGKYLMATPHLIVIINEERFRRYSVCSLVVPRLEEAILTPVLKKNFKRPSILGQEGHSYSQKHSNLSYDQFGGGLEQSDTAPLLLPPWLEEY